MTGKFAGFGFDPLKYNHFFSLLLPVAKGSPEKAVVKIVEHFEWKDSIPDIAAVPYDSRELKALISLSLFKEITEPVKAEFNRRLTAKGLPTGKWPAKGGTALLSPAFGKELLVLLWAIEDADPTLVQNAVRNWLGLSPEERWWLYTMTNAATGQAFAGRNRGWRKALRFALCENPITDMAIIRKKPVLELELFEDE
ncbi:MAG TPA: DUF3780 domain-containing protein [Termitinemataceae bacterium]|uniref:DUF3780 domain-containing protein n=1 Tax=Treponema sp. J25 TaxID=2094121 RepID=UPI0010523DEA|nr:DUF3780 domain-containing protein [Treponema sp. J25]TCW60565.1 DUF3780 domain-containing protein [Treponema sp. J25]HOJ99858.1 DUF3780 domain-containing protein [Termitinemataceae bacterium]HOM24042.1 DUF3780 domain-containing protein [Termitinemataceae bacterium]HPQ01509.1 DUF3780 domain-containing protein [Termitinemataceae bacterium]